jgi:hypothetical protein
MKRTVELDADEILNSLTKVRNRLHVRGSLARASRVTTEAVS